MALGKLRGHRVIVARAVVGLMLGAPVSAAFAEPPRGWSGGQTVSLQAARLTGAVRVDGRGDESAWRHAAPAGGFVQSYPAEGESPSESTRVSVLFDDKALYFLVEARDTRTHEVRALLTQRDLDSPSDWVEIWLNPQNDGLTGYRFSVNARGVQQDARLSLGGEVQDINWNAVWDSAVTRNEEGWTAEVRIPYSELRYDAGATTWGIQVVRRLARNNQTSNLAPVPKAAARPLNYMASLTGLPERPSASGLAVRPYGLMGITSQRRPVEPILRLGGDVRWNMTAATTLQATVLPDFGQVEQDPSQLNLSAFEISQTERRQFFLDGAENLTLELGYPNAFGEQLYYSRRVGARPTRVVDADVADVVTYPQQRTILGAAKLLGRTQRGLSFSFLNAITSQERATYRVGDELASATVASPTAYSIARLRKEVQRGRGQVGAAATWVHRVSNREMAREEVTDANTVAADWDLRWGDIGFKGQLVGSSLRGRPEAIDVVQRSSTNNLHRAGVRHTDYDPDAESLTGFGLALQGGKYDGTPLRAYWGGWLRSPGLNTNDLGFLRYADQARAEAGLTYRFDDPSAFHRFGELTSSAWAEETWGGELTSAGVSSQLTLHLANNSWVWAGGDRRLEALDPRLLRGGEAFLVPAVTGVWAGLDTDQRKSWGLKLDASGQQGDAESQRSGKLSVTGTFRPSPSWLLSLAPSAEWRRTDLQYVATLSEAGRDIVYLGDLSSQTLSLTLRASWAIALGLTLDIYASPFVTAGRYAEFFGVTDPDARDYEARREPRPYNGPDGYHFSQLRSNWVLRWDYAPGASFYAVWTHGQEAFRDDLTRAVPLRDLSQLLGYQATDTLLLKLGYFIGG